MMNVSLAGKIAWVTGGSGGIGASTVKALAAAGARVLSTDLAEPVPGTSKTADAVVYRRCDVTQQDDIDATVRYCRQELGGLDILVNNAGIQRRVNVFDVSRELWSTVMDVNLMAYFFCAQAAAKAMTEQGRGGVILNMVSVNSDYVYPDTIPYCTSKGGVKTLTKSLAVALGEYGIRVNGVSPGAVFTEINKDRWARPGERERVEQNTPLGRLGTPDEIGPSLAYLASEHASFITGSILDVHGGRLLRG